jgi:hypothetical protein
MTRSRLLKAQEIYNNLEKIKKELKDYRSLIPTTKKTPEQMAHIKFLKDQIIDHQIRFIKS